jgi:YVTN family beta-propeller protein
VVQRASGAVTFLCTDIEGSTRLLKQLRERYGDVLGAHQRLLREAFAAHGGDELDTQGDAFLVAFASARDAVLAAVAAQRALKSHEWPDGSEPRVRMGIHTGQALVSDGRYTGLAVHRAARICAAGHGGQLLVSQATQTLLEDEEEDLGVSVRDLGEQRLKDLDRPVRVYQVGAADLPADFPALRTEAAPTGAAEAVLAPPRRLSRRTVLAGAALALIAVAAVGAFLLTRSGTSGLSQVDPNNVGAIDPKTNAIIDQLPVGQRPGPIAASPDGRSVWVGDIGDRDVRRVDPRTREVTKTIFLDATPTGVAVGRGTVWVAEGLLGRLVRVDPRFETKRPIPLAFRPLLGAVSLGGGAVWAAFGDSTVVRVDLAGGRRRRAYAGDSPTGVAYYENAVWVVNGRSGNAYRYIPGTLEHVGTVTLSLRPSAVVGGAGSVWVTNSGANVVSRIDPRNTGTNAPEIPVGAGPTAIAYGAGSIWVANSGDGTVSRIDPASNRVVETIKVGNVPAGIAVAGRSIWVTVQARR